MQGKEAQAHGGHQLPLGGVEGQVGQDTNMGLGNCKYSDLQHRPATKRIRDNPMAGETPQRKVCLKNNFYLKKGKIGREEKKRKIIPFFPFEFLNSVQPSLGRRCRAVCASIGPFWTSRLLESVSLSQER